MKKIKAFTLLEVVINLAIMSIIISMVYLIYSYFSINLNNYVKTSSENFKVQSFYTLLREDFYNSEVVILENEKTIIATFYDLKNITYTHKNEFLIRQFNTIKDSIKIKEMQFEYFWGESSGKLKKHLNGLHITTSLYNKDMPLFVYKHYFLITD